LTGNADYVIASLSNGSARRGGDGVLPTFLDFPLGMVIPIIRRKCC